MSTKNEEYSYSYSGPKPIDVRPMLTDLGSGVIKGNTADLLGLPVDILDLGSNILSRNSESSPSTGSSQWFRSLLGMNPEDSSLSETAGTMISVPGLEKAMIVPFAKLAKRMNRTEDQQKYAEGMIKKMTKDDINPEVIYNLVRGYADKGMKTGEVDVKGLISDINAKVNQEVLTNLNKSSTVLGQILDHPELYELYPELKNIKVKGFENDPKIKGEKVSKDGKIQHIGLNVANKPEEAKEVLLHETQHAIQNLENWQSGANPNQFIRRNLEKALDKKLSSVKGTEAEARIMDLKQNLQNIYYKQYIKVPGEQEASFTQYLSNKNMKEVEGLVLNLLKKGKTPSSYRE